MYIYFTRSQNISLFVFNRRIIPLDTVEALLVNLEDMGGIHTERQDVCYGHFSSMKLLIQL